MKSYRDGDLSPEQIKELAASTPDSAIKEFLKEDEDNRPFILETEPEEALIMSWNVFGGPMVHKVYDPVRRFATLEYLRRYKYPVLRSHEEIAAYAKANDWPRKLHPKTGEIWFDW